MLPRGKRELGLRPAITEMEVMLVRRDWQAKQGQLAVEDDVVMAGRRPSSRLPLGSIRFSYCSATTCTYRTIPHYFQS